MRSFQHDQDARLTRMWNKGWTAKRIAEKLGYANRSTVSQMAKRLGLDSRLSAEQIELRHGPTPTIFRCEMCGGRSSDAAGHELCTNRMRAA